MDNSFSKEEITDKAIITTDIKLKMIQDKISKVIIKTPGIRTNNINIDISNVVDIIGRPSPQIVDRFALRWKIFGKDNNVNKEYKKLYSNLEKIKKNLRL